MKIISILLVLMPCFLFGQTDPNKREQDEKPTCVFLVVEQMPEFPGGEKELKKLIAKNIKYPEEAKQNNTEGVVYLRFVVLKSGKIGYIEIQRGINSLLDNEAVRVVKSLPKFTPGEKERKKVFISNTDFVLKFAF